MSNTEETHDFYKDAQVLLESVLQEIVRILMRQYHPADLPIQLLAILPHNHFKSFPLCTLLLKEFQNFAFVIRNHNLSYLYVYLWFQIQVIHRL